MARRSAGALLTVSLAIASLPRGSAMRDCFATDDDNLAPSEEEGSARETLHHGGDSAQHNAFESVLREDEEIEDTHVGVEGSMLQKVSGLDRAEHVHALIGRPRPPRKPTLKLCGHELGHVTEEEEEEEEEDHSANPAQTMARAAMKRLHESNGRGGWNDARRRLEFMKPGGHVLVFWHNGELLEKFMAEIETADQVGGVHYRYGNDLDRAGSLPFWSPDLYPISDSEFEVYQSVQSLHKRRASSSSSSSQSSDALQATLGAGLRGL